jgi:2,3-bisphosphoglycerate-independent phosphoglycerate mutase
VSQGTRYIVLLGDGMADRPLKELGGNTPLMAANTPNMDHIASEGILGLVRTIPDGMAMGSDVANLAVLGYDPSVVYTGRSPIEAAGIGVEIGPGDVAYRCNLVTLGREVRGSLVTDLKGEFGPDLVMVDFAGGHPDEKEGVDIVTSLEDELGGEGIEFHPGVSYRHLMVWRDGIGELSVDPPHDLTDKKIGLGWPRGAAAARVLDLMSRSVGVLAPHPVNVQRGSQGKKPVNAIWLWGQGLKPGMKKFRDVYGLEGAMITAVDLMRGLAVSIGFKVIHVPGATGYLDTNFDGKASAAIEALKEVDIVYLHVEAPDEAGHGGSITDKIKAMEDFDTRVVGPVLKGLKELGPHRVLLMPDHATPIELKTHSGDPVPFAIYDSEISNGSGRTYDEACAAASGIHIDHGHELMGKFVRGEL